MFYCVGNHELWLSHIDMEATPDSIEKFFKIIELVESLGAHSTPKLVRSANPADAAPAIAIVPLQSWYKSGFLPPELAEKATKWEDEMRKQYYASRAPRPSAPPAASSSGSSPANSLHRRNQSAKNLARLDSSNRRTPLRRDSSRLAQQGDQNGEEGLPEDEATGELETEAWADAWVDLEEAAAEVQAEAEAAAAAAEQEAAEKEARRLRREARDKAQVEGMDGMCRWPRCFDSREHEGGPSKRELLSAWFAALNRPVVDAAREAPEALRPRSLVTYSHFLPTPKLHRGPRFLGEVEGSSDLGDVVRELKPNCHVFGHTVCAARSSSRMAESIQP